MTGLSQKKGATNTQPADIAGELPGEVAHGGPIDPRDVHCGHWQLALFADLMASLGADRALNLDGGGSATMYVDGRLVNVPTDAAGERVVANHLGVCAR